MRTLIEPNNSLTEIREIVTLELKKAVASKRHPFKYVAFNTTNAKAVNSRYVVLRKFTEKETYLIFTDARSEKVTDLLANKNCSLLFYHSGKKLQVRVNGIAIIHQNNELSQQYWNGVQGSGRKAYTSINSPRETINSPLEAFEWNASMGDTNFTVLEILPKQIEVLQLNGDEHIRASFTNSDGDWIGSFLMP